ncbi:MAG: hypothetical protein M3126_10775 [Candidatus Eremiobacteraeota bacterium]|nr:hypothetical protein [Candidatus Eremiobacteraeota bacterium]
MEKQRCSNLSCVCEVPLMGDACSDYCKSGGRSDAEEIICHCGHQVCADEMKADLSEGAPAS